MSASDSMQASLTALHPALRVLLARAVRGEDGIYSAGLPVADGAQAAERELRERVAARQYKSYLGAIAESHSIEVMDREVDRFLGRLPRGAAVLDVGGCWGWHWRRLAQTRPDVGVLIIDFVRPNLRHAQRVLGALVDTQVALMQADATELPFPDGISGSGLDGVWTVQVFQHIPDFRRACEEAARVLRPGGQFACYSLHRTPLNRAIYWLLGKPFHTSGMVGDIYHLTRASDAQRRVIGEVFGEPVGERYTECLFHPDFTLARSGRAGSLLGRVDARLSGGGPLRRLIARQRSFEAIKR